VALERHFHAFGQQTFAAALTPPGESSASTFGAHSRTEAVLLFAGPLRGLVGAFHIKNPEAEGEKSRYLRRTGRFVNVAAAGAASQLRCHARAIME